MNSSRLFRLVTAVGLAVSVQAADAEAAAARPRDADGSSVPLSRAKGDGRTDDTAAIQAALDEATRAGGGKVILPSARYLVKGSLRIPAGVTLEGVMEAPVWSAPLKGTIISENNGVRGVEIHNELGDRAVLVNNEPATAVSR